MGTSNLQPNWTEGVGNLGTNYLQLACEVGGYGGQTCRNEPLFTYGIWCYLQVVSDLSLTV